MVIFWNLLLFLVFSLLLGGPKALEDFQWTQRRAVGWAKVNSQRLRFACRAFAPFLTDYAARGLPGGYPFFSFLRALVHFGAGVNRLP